MLAFCGLTAGGFVARYLPKDHLSPESKSIINLGAGLVITMLALLLSLQLSSVKTAFDEQQMEVTGIATDVTILDAALAHSGTGAAAARSTLRRVVGEMVRRAWPDEQRGTRIETPADAADLYDRIEEIRSSDESQRDAKSEAVSLALALGEKVRFLSGETASSTLMPLLIIELVWIAMIYGGFGLLAPRNRTVVATLMLSASAIACAIFLIVDLTLPFSGLIRISSTPLRVALEQIGH